MGSLVYTAITSLDGYVNDESGGFDWAAPDEEVHAFVNALERDVGTYLLGRRMYDVMSVWDTPEAFEPHTDATREFAEGWATADKVVYSRTLAEVTTKRTRLERAFDPEAVRALKDGTDRSVGVGGPGLAAAALTAGLVDEVSVFLTPVVVGGGTSWLPRGLRLGLELLDQRRFGNGTVHLRYRVS